MKQLIFILFLALFQQDTPVIPENTNNDSFQTAAIPIPKADPIRPPTDPA
jgi:hypothetical protein